MKQIGLLSDTHGWLDDAVFRHFASCDEIWHAGDIGDSVIVQKLSEFKPLRAVWGNIDAQAMRLLCPEHQRFHCEDVDVWITHIGGKPGNYALPVRETMKSDPPQLFVCGHSHILFVGMDKMKKVLHMNPGAAGRSGFHKMRTMLRFRITGDLVHDLEVIELGLK